ncbi:MAG: hypothetical protein ACLFP6_11695 [Spirochaetaceae bacterium]
MIRYNKVPGDFFSAIAWRRLADHEIVVRIAGPEEAVRESVPDLIRLAKSVGPGVGDRTGDTGSSTGTADTETAPVSAAATRRTPSGLQFSDPTGTWRWSADLADGFIVTATAPPRVRVAVWSDEEAVRFQVLPAEDGAYDAAARDDRVQTLLRDSITLRGAAPGGDR